MQFASAWRRSWHASLLTSALAGTVVAQTPPLAPATLQRRREQAAVQELESAIRTAVKEASDLQRTEPAKAVDKLKPALERLQNDHLLSADRRETLTRVVRDRIRTAEAGPPTAAELAAADRDHLARQRDQQEAVARQQEEATKVRQGLAEVKKLQTEGKADAARKRAEELLKAYPDSPATRVANGVADTTVRLKENHELAADYEKRTLAALTDIDRAALPANGDIEFPKDWKEKTAKRAAKSQLTVAERSMLETLARPYDVQLKGSRLQDAADYFSTLLGQTVILDKAALDEKQMTYDSPVSFSPKFPVPARTALRATFVGLTYVVKDGIIHITSPERAREMTVTRTYYIGDLVNGLGALSGGAPRLGAGVDQVQMAQNFQAITEMVLQSVDPGSWEGRGGVGKVGYNVATMSLIVRQSAEVHLMLKNSLMH